MPNLPGRRYFTTQELAEHWGKTAEEIEHYFKEFGLRRAFRLSEQRLSIGGDEIESFQISLQDATGAAFDHQHWLYVVDSIEVEQSEAAVLVGEKPGYFHPDFETWVDDPVRRVSVEDFEQRPAKLMLTTESRALDIEMGLVDLYVPLEETERFENHWDETLSAPEPLSNKERDTLSRIIARLALELSKKDKRCRHGEEGGKPNYQGIGEVIVRNLPEGESTPSVRTIRDKLKIAQQSLFSD
ncbi:MAG: hypothetical protein JJ957_19150 [Pseudomonadales bacterium]|nr:hypothetical protein [Pseudomonadales bacterium]MBO6597612.1 hypothetical protein [Pseudomonadales bacterium]MBO6824338.1 hypothetical protein [Pseudomonadales bacterium]